VKDEHQPNFPGPTIAIEVGIRCRIRHNLMLSARELLTDMHVMLGPRRVEHTTKATYSTAWSLLLWVDRAT
jgi:hypothetical protein